jgi:uncharacterized protein
MWIQREIEPVLRSLAASRPAVVVTGARQSGKTSLLRNTFPGHNYVSLDIPRDAERAESSGEEFLAKLKTPVIIDEIQYAPGLLRHVKAAIDRQRDRMGRYLLTGSQRFELMRGVTESLAGRTSVLVLHGLSAREITAWSGVPADRTRLLELIYRGGYPELWERDLAPDRFYADYATTYLERDVRSAIQVRSLRDFDRFMRLCAARTGQLVSMSALASDLGLSSGTVRAWTSVLEASSVVGLLEPYHGNLGKRLVKTPKLYFLDTGLLCSLLGFRSAADLERSSMLGAIFETFVYGQIVRRFANRGQNPNVFFFRDHQGHEVDFVVPVGEKLNAVECKWAERPDPRHRGIEHLRSLVGKGNMLGATVITPERGGGRVGEMDLDDPVSLDFLAV